jgi:hypothetical protein
MLEAFSDSNCPMLTENLHVPIKQLYKAYETLTQGLILPLLVAWPEHMSALVTGRPVIL